eukprot:2261149-Pyramimonas_sp.AAC.1
MWCADDLGAVVWGSLGHAVLVRVLRVFRGIANPRLEPIKNASASLSGAASLLARLQGPVGCSKKRVRSGRPSMLSLTSHTWTLSCGL